MEFWRKRTTSELPNTKNVESKERKYTHDFDAISSPEDFINAVDFATLNGIFDEMSGRSEDENQTYRSRHKVEPEKIQFLEIIEHEGMLATGRAFIETGDIELQWKLPDGETMHPAEVISILNTLAHEATHIRGGFDHTESVEWLNDRSLTLVSKIKFGLEEISEVENGLEYSETKKGLPLNEAVTENIGQEVLREYLIRTGNSSYLMDEKVNERLGYGAYFNERFVLAFVLETLSERLEVPVAELWKALTHAYINGNQDVIKVITEISDSLQDDPELMKLLHALSNENQVEQGYYSALDQVATIPELPRINLFKRFRVSKERMAAFNKRWDSIDALKFEANALGSALGLRK